MKVRNRIEWRVPSVKVSRTNAVYCRPKGKNDLKRHGRQLTLIGDNFSVTLDGTQINTIKSILAEAGEIKVLKGWRK